MSHFSLRTLLVLLLLASVCAADESAPAESVSWQMTFGNSDPTERARLAGNWRVVLRNRKPPGDDVPHVVRFDTDEIELLPPEGKQGHFDRLLPDGSRVRAIYRFEGTTMIVSESKPDRPRPKGYHAGKIISVWKAERE